MREFGGGFVIVNAVVSGKGVIDGGITVAGHMRVAGQALGDCRLRRLVDKFIFLRDMKDRRRGDIYGLVQPFVDADTIIADIAFRVGPAGHKIGQQPW